MIKYIRSKVINLYYNDNDKKLYYKNENDKLEIIKRLPVVSSGFYINIKSYTDEEIANVKKFMDTNFYNVYEDNNIIRYLVFCK